MAINFQKIITGDTIADRIQANITNAFNSVSGPFIGGNSLSNVSIKTTDTSINHGLGRTPVLWVITDQDTLTNVARTAWDETSITLKAGIDCVISLYVN